MRFTTESDRNSNFPTGQSANTPPLIIQEESGSCANMPGPGGSRRGIPNRRTLYKQYTERAAALMKIDGADFVGENLNAMGEALARCQTIPAALHGR